jgi:hypothetical protein
VAWTCANSRACRSTGPSPLEASRVRRMMSVPSARSRRRRRKRTDRG